MTYSKHQRPVELQCLHADDTKLFSAIKSKDDVTALQTDLGTLEQWSTVSGLSFNQSKSKHQTLPRKLVPVASSYKLDDTIISSTDNEKDLGVVSSDLTWKKQVNEQTVKANRILGYVRRNNLCIKNTAARRALYLALVRSHFGYATQIWLPQSVDLISKLERTQRRATKYILNLPFSTTIDYKSVYWKTRARTRGHGQADTDTQTLMEKTGSYGKDGQLWKRRAVMEKTGSYGKDGHLWKRRTFMEKTDTKHLKPIF